MSEGAEMDQANSGFITMSGNTTGVVYVTDVTAKREMSVTEQVRKQRADVIERARAEQSFDAYETAWTEPFEHGAVVAWGTAVAALDARWRSTRHNGPEGSTEDLIAWLVEHKVNVDEVTILRVSLSDE